MKKIYLSLCLSLLLVLTGFYSGAQIATTISGGSSANGSYTTFESAITALNGSTISGPVTVDVTAGQSETITGKITLTATGTSSNPITIQRSGAGANPVLVAYTGTVATPSVIADGFFVLAGSDYVTIDGLDLQENAGNTTTTTVMEFGYGLFKASATDGCQYNTIKNCTITLNRLQNTAWTAPGHNGSVGIAILNGLHTASGAVSVTAASGSNSFNNFYSNTIQNCNAGISFVGFAAATPFTFGTGGFGDSGNDVGGNTSGTGNTILNYGGGAITNPATGIFANNQWDLNVSYNTINNNNGSGVNHATTLRGIFLNASSTSASVNCNYNTITVTCGATTSQLTGIENSFGSTAAGNTVNINNNNITTYYPTATTGLNYGIFNTSATPANLNMNNNTVAINTGATGGSTLAGIYNTGAVTTSININNNTISGINCTAAASSATIRAIYNTGGATTCAASINNNSLANVSFAGTCTGGFYFITESAAVGSLMVNNNTLNNITTPSSGIVQLWMLSNSCTNVTVTGNQIGTAFVNNNATASTSSFEALYNFGVPTSGTHNIYNNDFSNITLNRSPTVSIGSSTGPTVIFWATNAGPTHNVYNNTINNITNNGTGLLSGIYVGYGANNNVYSNTITNFSSGAVIGINSGNSSTVNINTYNNTISGLTATSAAGNAYGILHGTSATLGASGIVNTYNNKICNVTANGATGASHGIYHFKGLTTNIYNNIIGGINAPNSSSLNAVNGINIATTAAADNIRIYFNTVYLTGTSTAVDFGSSAIFANTTPNVDLRNNILSNLTTPVGTGLAVAYRRSSTTLGTFNAASNNNLLYAGTPGASNVIFYDGTTAQQTMTDYKNLVTPRDASSLSSDITTNLLSTACGSTDFLHIDASIPTQLESGGLFFTSPIAVTTDIDGDTRGSIPDLGADEFNGTTPAPFISLTSVTPGYAAQCSATQRDIQCDVTTLGGTITTVDIQFSFNGVAQTPVAMTNIGGDTYLGSIPAATPSNAVVTWSIVATNTLSLTTSLTGTSYSDDILSSLVVSAVASANPICDGIATTLTASASYPAPISVGAGVATSATYSNPFYSLYSNTHNQHLILASELSALGMYAGDITALGLNITAPGTLPMLDFSLKMGLTSATNVSSFVSTTMTPVYSSASLLPVAGLNTLSFSTPFAWDGVSNIVIEICHGNAASTATMSRTCQTDNTPFVSSIHTHKTTATSGTLQCADNTTNLLTYSIRPRFYFTANIAASNFNWSDGVNSVGTTASISVTPNTNTTYTATFDALGCTATTPGLLITVNPVPAAPTATNSSQCGVAIPTANVSSNAGAQGTGQYFWYDAATAGNVVQYPPVGTSLITYYNNDFSSPTLSNSFISGNASIGSGFLTLTPNLINQAGGITVNAPIVYNPTKLQVNFDASTATTTADLADGFSYSYGDDVSATSTTPSGAETGTGSKLRVGFDTYGAAAGAAGIYLIYGTTIANPGQTVGTNGVLAYSTNTSFVNTSNNAVQIEVDPTGLCNVTLNGNPIFTGVQLPPAYVAANKSTWMHVVKARSGGIAGNFVIDNLHIQTNQFAAGHTTWQNLISSTQTWYVSEKSTDGCETYRTPVTATVTAPPTLTITPTKTICNGYVQQLTVTSVVGDYDTYTWSPITNLYTDAAGTIAYTGGNTPTVYYKSTTAGSETISCTSSEVVNGCSNLTTATMNVLPAAITVSSTPDNLCVSGNAVISFTPTTPLFNATLQWSESPTGSGYTPISGANGLTYAVTGLSSSNYYQMNITDDNSTVCLSDDFNLVVNNPTVASTTPGSRCGTGTVNLSATAGGSGLLKWYTAATGGAPVATGPTYTTPIITASTDYYVSSTEGAASAYVPGGNTWNQYTTVGSFQATLITGAVMIFSTTSGTTIESLDIYPSAAIGTPFTIQVRQTSGSGAIIASYSGVTTVQNTGSPTIAQTVPCNLVIPAGSNYVIGFSGTNPSCWRGNITNFPYPFSIPGVINITGASASGTATSPTLIYQYYFYNWKVVSGCESARTLVPATVVTAPPITVANTTICNTQSSTLSVTSPNDPDYTYTWMPGNLVGPTHTVNPSTTTVYTVSAVDNTSGPNAGCALVATQTVTVHPLPTLSATTATPSSVNPGCGTIVDLTATTSAPINVTVGNPATALTTTGVLNPFNSNWEGSRVQMLVLASELSALGITSGNINSIGFEVTSLGTGTFAQQGFTIKMGHTSTAAFTTGNFATVLGSLNTVYGPITQGLPVVGVNTFTLSTPFAWNGVDNVVLEICHDNDISASCAGCFSSNSSVKYTTTSFNSIIGRNADDVQSCGVATTNAPSTLRPNILINGIAGQITNKTWEPGTLVGNTVTVVPTATTTYTVTATNPVTGCTQTSTTTVTVNPDATLTGLSATYFTTDAAVTMTGTPAGGVFSGPGVTGSSFDPATAGVGTHTISYMPTGYCVAATYTVTVSAPTATLNLTAFLEGYVTGLGTMNEVLSFQGLPNPITDCDDVTVELHDATIPYAMVHTFSGILQTNGTLACTFPGSAVGNSYYIVVKNRNHMETWSAAPVTMAGTTSYNFSTAQSQAFGTPGNLVETPLGSGQWAMYSGDINQDLSIDAQDYLLLDPDIVAGNGGYLTTDLNGDGSVDALDYLILDPNISAGITIQAP